MLPVAHRLFQWVEHNLKLSQFIFQNDFYVESYFCSCGNMFGKEGELDVCNVVKRCRGCPPEYHLYDGNQYIFYFTIN